MIKLLLLLLPVSIAHVLLPPQLYGQWRMAYTTAVNVKDCIGELSVLPYIDKCKVEFTIHKDIMSTTISQTLKGKVKRKHKLNSKIYLQWCNNSHSRLSVCGLGCDIKKLGLKYGKKPVGTPRSINVHLINDNVMQVKYDNEQYLFTRSSSKHETIRLPLELWVLTQVLSELYKMHP